MDRESLELEEKLKLAPWTSSNNMHTAGMTYKES